MPWQRREIKLEDIPSVVEQGFALAKAGSPIIEQMRCVFTLENDNIIYSYPLLDYLDNLPDEKVTSFTLYQMVN